MPTSLTSHPDANDANGTAAVSSGENTLPAFLLMNTAQFIWGECDTPAFMALLDSAYKEVVFWRRNCFSIPNGHIGQMFVN